MNKKDRTISLNDQELMENAEQLRAITNAELLKENEELKRDLAHLLLRKSSIAQQQWIPVSEKLPEWDIECLVVDDKGEFGVGFYRDDVGAWDSPSWGWLERKDDVDNYDAYYMPCGISKVVAWMPLPQPYREDSE